MTSVSDIEKQIQNDYNRFYNSVYDGELPNDLITRFRKALMALAPSSHKYNNNALKGIISKKENDLTVLEAGIVINVLFDVPFHVLYDNIEQALDENWKLEIIREKFNESVDAVHLSLNKKKERLMNLSGVTGSAPFKSIKAEA